MYDFINLLSKEASVSVLESEIEIDRAISNYMTESDMMSIIDVYTESEESRDEAERSKFSQVIKRIIDAVKKLAIKVAEGFKDIFIRDDMTADDYFSDPNVRIKINQDMEAMAKEIEDEVIKGRKIVQAISKGTGVDDHVVANFCDRAANIGTKEGKYVITGAACMAIGRKMRSKSRKMFNDLDADGRLLDKAVNAKIKEMKRDAEDARINAKYAGKPKRKAAVAGAVHIRRQASEVYSSLGKLVSKYFGLNMELQRNIRAAKKNLS